MEIRLQIYAERHQGLTKKFWTGFILFFPQHPFLLIKILNYPLGNDAPPFPHPHLVGHVTQVCPVRALHRQSTVASPSLVLSHDSFCRSCSLPLLGTCPTTLPPSQCPHLANFHSSFMSWLISPPPPKIHPSGALEVLLLLYAQQAFPLWYNGLEEIHIWSFRWSYDSHSFACHSDDRINTSQMYLVFIYSSWKHFRVIKVK